MCVLNVCVKFYSEKKPDEIKKFVNDHFETHLKYCDIKKIRFALETKKVIDYGQRLLLDACHNKLEANTKFREFLLNQPCPETLLAAADVLETAPDTTSMNKKFAEAIRQFLSSEGIYVFQLLTEYIYNIL